MKILNRFKVKQKLWLILGVVALGFALLITFSLTTLRHALHDSKVEEIQALSDVASSVIESYHQRYERGELSEAQARERALEELRHLRYLGEYFFWVTDMTPEMVMHPMRPELEGTDVSSVRDPNGVRLYVEMADAASAEGHGLVEYQWLREGHSEPADKIAYVKGFAPWGWVVGTGIYLKDVNAAFERTLTAELVEAGVILAVLLLLILAVQRSITGPLNQASATMVQLAEDFDLTRKLPDEGRDELSAMARAFNLFLGKTRETLSQVGSSTEELAAASEELSVITTSTREGVEQQQGETQQVATAVTEMSTTIQEIASSAESAAAAAKGADGSAQAGQAKVEEVMNAIRDVADRVQEAAEVVQRLNAESDAIGTVLEVITGVAEQTNLLALNAAIEAARAGEQGRGFAVVADEVRSLASRTQESTTEIRTMIERLQTGSGDAVGAIEQSRETASGTVTQAEQAASSLAEIVRQVGTIGQMNDQIASAAEEQATVAEQINQNVVSISSLSEQTSDNAAHTASASEELAKLGEQLRTLVNQFKTG